MKKMMLLAMLLVASGAAWAAEGKFGTDVDLTWASKFIWRGLDLGDNKAAFQPKVNFDLWGSGFSAEVMGSWLGGPTNGAEAAMPTELLRYGLAYGNSFNKGDTAQVDYELKWTYWDYYATGSEVADFQDLAFSMAFPKVFGNSGFVPKYTIAYSWSGRPGPTGGALGNGFPGPSGFVHIFGLDYNFKACDVPLTLSAEGIYNDGVYGGDHEWSDIVWGLSSSFKLGGGQFVPGIYYQTSMDDSINQNDEFWTTLSYRFSF